MQLLTEVPSGGGFFNAKDHMASLAFLIEVHEYMKDVPGKFGPKDQIVADVTEFKSKGMIDGDEDPIVLTRVRLEGKGIVQSLKDNVGKALVAKLIMRENPKAGFKDFPVFVTADPAAIEGVVKYVKKREEAEKAAMEEIPDFLK